MSTRVLVIDDDMDIRKMLRRTLTADGFVVDTAASASAGLQQMRALPPDVVVLDLNLPDHDGIAVCEMLRGDDDQTPILMLTARDSAPERVAGLRAGADDYLTKPYEHEELVLRIEALMRRSMIGVLDERDIVSFGPIVVDASARSCTVDGADVELTPREFDLLEIFVRNPGIALRRERLMEEVWEGEVAADSNAVVVYIGYLRRKLADHGAGHLLRTMHGVGYVLRDDAQRALA